LISQILKLIGYTSTSGILVLFLFYLFYPTPFSRSPSSVTKIDWVSSPLESTVRPDNQLGTRQTGSTEIGKVIWQDCEGKADLANCRWEDFPPMTWEQARDHCEEKSQNNIESWRLPTLAETQFSDSFRLIRTAYSPGLWTSDQAQNYPGFFWVRDITSGIPTPEPKSSLFLARCVQPLLQTGASRNVEP